MLGALARRGTIQSRIVALSVTVLLASQALSAAVAYAVLDYTLWQRHDEALEAVVATVATAFQTGISVENGDEAEAAHHMLNELHFPDSRIAIFTEDGAPFPPGDPEHHFPKHVHAPSAEISAAEVLAIAAASSPAGDRPALVTRRTPAGDARFAVAPFRSSASGARYWIAAERSNAEVEQSLGLLRVALLVVAPLFLAIAWLGGRSVARGSLAPLGEMTARAESINENNLGERLPVVNPSDELGKMALVFNSMLDRLERAFVHMRQFTADASHELRTPLAAIRGESQVTLMRGRSEREYRESIGVILEETTHMSRIVEDLFLLARADAGEQPIAREPVDLGELAAECARAVRPLADQKGHALAVSLPERQVTVAGDEPLLRRVLLNLLQNAVKYTPDGGSVRVAVEADGREARVSVADTGIGMTAAERDRAFERFYRADKARSRSEGGAGLGLAIARWVVAAHGGTIDIETEPGRGSEFVVRLPGEDGLAADDTNGRRFT